MVLVRLLLIAMSCRPLGVALAFPGVGMGWDGTGDVRTWQRESGLQKTLQSWLIIILINHNVVF